MSNPLLEDRTWPPFNEIKPEHVPDALDALLNQAREGIAAIVANPNPDYLNAIEKRDQVEDLLSKSWGTVSHLNSVCSNEELRKVYNEGLPKLSAYSTEMGQNEDLYQVYANLSMDGLDEAQRKSVEDSLIDFRLSGIGLDPHTKKRCGEIDERLSTLQANFSDNVLDATMAWTLEISDEGELAGLPPSALDLLRQNAQQKDKAGYLITLDFPSYIAVMTHADNRDLRRQVYEAYSTKASDCGPHAGQRDNGPLLAEIVNLRQERARLLGYSNPAEISLVKKMANSPREVLDLLEDLRSRALPQARKEVVELRDFAKDSCSIEDLQAWDTGYVSEKLKESRYQFSQEETKPYFPLERVLEGLFDITRRLFSVDIEVEDGAETWHEDVRRYVIRRSGEAIAHFYLDPYAREHKRGGAWMDECRCRQKWSDHELQLPVAYLVCNASPPAGEEPSQMTHEEVTTLFHEFGHGLHHMMTRIDVSTVSGINGVAWDAVELPSQFMENFCWQAELLPSLSGHVKTGEPLPQDLLNRMLAAKNFQSAMGMVRQLEFGLFDFNLHLQEGEQTAQSVQELLDGIRSEMALIPSPPFNRFQNSFTHIFSGGYAAGYYSYMWAEVLSADAFSRFEEEGLFNQQVAADFLNNTLSMGGVRPAGELFAAFRGRPPQTDALLRHCGIGQK